jgi:hypothetical protein
MVVPASTLTLFGPHASSNVRFAPEAANHNRMLWTSAFVPDSDIAHPRSHVGFVPILLRKSFWGGERKFLEPLMRFMRGNVRDHIVSSKIDHEPPQWR